MKRRYILAAVLALFMGSTKARGKDSVFRKKTVSKTDIEVMYSQYIQDGHNSPVTGGIGTEKLTVYSPNVKLKRVYNNGSNISLKFGSDIISSASTDNIDFVKSSASLVDSRTYGSLGITTRPIGKKGLVLNAGSGFSIESDYFSIPVNMGIMRSSRDRMKTFSADLQMYFDDLRWGRLNPDIHRPEKLIYPVELRYRNWYQTTRRQSYNLKLAHTRVINKRNIIGIYPEGTLQHGLLATPFHRVYFRDSSLRVENLPSLRLRGTLGLKWNSFAGGRTILKNAVDLYSDNFGILGLGIENETAIKVTPTFTLTVFGRYYNQKGSVYFAPYLQHDVSEAYYTSDYDLSRITTVKAGAGIRIAPFSYMRKNLMFNDLVLRYAYYHRSNGLHANIISCVISFSHIPAKKTKSSI